MLRLQDKIAIVTGGASGLGKAIAERFVLEGAKVVIADTNQEAGLALASKLSKAGTAIFIQVDVTNPISVQGLIKETLQRLKRLDILINNAGIDGEQAPTAECTLENWRKVLAVNLDGVFYGLKYGLEAIMKNTSGGSIINMASVAGMIGFPGIPAYNAAKGGVIQLTRATAVEYAAHGIRVNAICPTGVMTPLVEHFVQNSDDPDQMRKAMNSMNPMPGMPSPEDVAAATLFLASNEARFITGVALPIDGGYTAR
ncbi:MAG: SDR family oxidoreductase [Proteobacteria bacterium]|nr:SDR family oxidoreductase [Pseudomonadota bacterium]